jgi:hypothetical protein
MSTCIELVAQTRIGRLHYKKHYQLSYNLVHERPHKYPSKISSCTPNFVRTSNAARSNTPELFSKRI